MHRLKIIASFFVIVLGLFLLFKLYNNIAEKPATGRYLMENGNSFSVAYPFNIPNQPVGSYHLSFDILFSPFSISSYKISADDCLESISINGEIIADTSIPYCDFQNIRSFDLSPYLSVGRNHFTITARNTGGNVMVQFAPANADLHMAIFIIFLLTLIWITIRIITTHYIPSVDFSLSIILGLGTALRILYTLATPFTVRAHDAMDHIDYIRYVAFYLHIPPASGGWEYHQAPLYYILAGLYYRFVASLGISEYTLLLHLRMISLLLNCGCLFIGCYLSFILFPSDKHKWERYLFTAFIAVFPATVFFSSRLSNDALYQLGSFMICAILLLWWKKPTSTYWYILAAGVAITYLTKLSALVFIPIIFICLLVQASVPIRQKILRSIIFASIVILIAGWLPIMRLYLEQDTTRTRTLGNEGMNSNLSLPTNISGMATFNPLEIVRHPFNDPWENTERRQYFPEYYYRSAFFGEFHFDNMRKLSQILLGISFFLIPLAIVGFMYECKKNKFSTLPLHLIFFTVIASSVSYRIHFPYAPNQDFRFVTILIIPVGFYIIKGINALPKQFQFIANAIFCIFLLLCSVFIWNIFYQS
ncbi:MAG: hypothetical protein JWM56_130 [Candidatus Peribacteria bacterium]|nr:hypothetical protein [Candidatus Peribacteria bacterium]